MTATYQEIFNNHLKSIRRLCNATGNDSFAKEIVGVMFDFSDELKKNNILKDKDNAKTIRNA